MHFTSESESWDAERSFCALRSWGRPPYRRLHVARAPRQRVHPRVCPLTLCVGEDAVIDYILVSAYRP